MQIDWNKTLEEIFSGMHPCPRCGMPAATLMAGYTRSPEAAAYAPRCQNCTHKDDCDARKLVIVCEQCARETRLRARPVDEEGIMTLLMNEVRRELEECLDYLADYWMEDLDIDPEDVGKRLEEVDPEVFAEESAWRRHLEEEYLQLHRWFREHGKRIPNPAWRAEYVEEIIGLGYETLLGD